MSDDYCRFFTSDDTHVFCALVAYLLSYRVGNSNVYLLDVGTVDRLPSEPKLSAVHSIGRGSSDALQVWNTRVFLPLINHGGHVDYLEYGYMEARILDGLVRASGSYRPCHMSRRVVCDVE